MDVVSDIEIAERYSRSRVSPAVETSMRGLEVKKQYCNDPNPFRLDHDGDPFRALPYLSPPLYLAGPLSSLFPFSLSPFLTPPARSLFSPLVENSSACLYVVWSRAMRYNATPGCIVNQTHQTHPMTAVRDDI